MKASLSGNLTRPLIPLPSARMRPDQQQRHRVRESRAKRTDRHPVNGQDRLPLRRAHPARTPQSGIRSTFDQTLANSPSQSHDRKSPELRKLNLLRDRSRAPSVCQRARMHESREWGNRAVRQALRNLKSASRLMRLTVPSGLNGPVLPQSQGRAGRSHSGVLRALMAAAPRQNGRNGKSRNGRPFAFQHRTRGRLNLPECRAHAG